MAALTKAELKHIADLWLAYTTEHGTFAVEAAAWKEILTPELYRKAVSAGYFGAPGSVAGIDYEGSTFTVAFAKRHVVSI